MYSKYTKHNITHQKHNNNQHDHHTQISQTGARPAVVPAIQPCQLFKQNPLQRRRKEDKNLFTLKFF